MIKNTLLFAFILLHGFILKAQDKLYLMGTASFSNQSEYYDNLPIVKNPSDWELTYNAVIDYRIKEHFLIGIYSGFYFFNRQYNALLFTGYTKTYSYGLSTGYVSKKFFDERLTYHVLLNYYLYHTKAHIEANGKDNRTNYQYGNGLSMMPGITFWATKHFGIGLNLNFNAESIVHEGFSNFSYFNNTYKMYTLQPKLNLFLSL